MFIILQMYNKTIIEFGFCDMQNCQGVGKRYTDTDTDISQHTPFQGFSVTGYIVNR
jgi:hypothetical protein